MRPSRVVRGIRNRAAAREIAARLAQGVFYQVALLLRQRLAQASDRRAVHRERGLAAHGLGAVVGERHLIQQCAALPVQQQAAPDHVFQLPDVARPVAGQQLRQRPLAKSGDTRVEAARIATDERPCQQFHIAGALAQRRDAQAAHVQTVVQVLAQASLGDRLARRLVARRDQAHIGPLRAQAAQRQVAAVLQDPQQLALHGHRHGIDLVEEQAAALRQGEHALAVLGAGESAAGGAEQGTFQQRLGNRCAVQADHRTAASRAQGMGATGEQFLAGAGLAMDQQRQVGGRENVQALQLPQQARRHAQDVRAIRQACGLFGLGDDFAELHRAEQATVAPAQRIARWRYCNSSPPAPT